MERRPFTLKVIKRHTFDADGANKKERDVFLMLLIPSWLCNSNYHFLQAASCKIHDYIMYYYSKPQLNIAIITGTANFFMSCIVVGWPDPKRGLLTC